MGLIALPGRGTDADKEKAAAAGSAWAAVNLSWATSWGLPGYADRAAGEAKLAPYLAGATPPQLVAYARILSGMEGGPKALFNREKARELATRAAEAGLPDGLLLLQELK